MAQCKLTPQDFIRDAFTPQIAVMCSPEAERTCQKNNLSFIELLQPFSKLNHDVYYKDPTNLVITLKNLKLTFLDINAKPPQTTTARKYLNSAVSDAPEPKAQTIKVREHDLNIPVSTPWFEAWRETFLMVQYPSDHEFTKHFLACMLVASSQDHKPAETMISMAQTFNHIVNNSQGSLPKWFSSNVLKYYIIIHDNISGDINVAEEAYEAVKSSFGSSNVFLLRMNSRPLDAVVAERLPDPWSQFLNTNIITHQVIPSTENSPVSQRSSNVEIGQEVDEGQLGATYHPLSPANEDLSLFENNSENERLVRKTSSTKEHGFCLSSEDVEQVKLLLYEFCKMSMIPYVERQMQQLNESVSNKKGVSRSLFSATRRWFNPNKPGASAVATTNLTYVSDSPEIQIRKLGDLYFMFAHYTGAFHAYHNAKRDYNSDQAWLHYAGALEMASLSAFMANELSKKTTDYMEESILTYLNTCKMPQFATRATLLSTECLKKRGMYGEAAHQFIRMTSEDSDLRSALLLEQAAYCFLHSRMMRKYAFHMVLAGHRFSKAAQRKHSLRCYKQAYQIYMESGWDLAEDHINYTIGRQSNNLQFYPEAVEAFAKLLTGDSKQTGEQQNIILKEYLTIVEQYSQGADSFENLRKEDRKQSSEQKSIVLKNYFTHLENKFKKTGIKDNFILPVPHLDSASVRLLTTPAAPLTTPGRTPATGTNFEDDIECAQEVRWQKLEEMLVQEAQGSLPLLFKPSVSLYDRTRLLKTKPVAIIHEPVRVSVSLVNSLKIPLNLKDIQLVWSFSSTREDVTIKVSSNETEAEKHVKTHVLKSVVIPENSRKNIVLTLSPLAMGSIRLLGVAYTLMGSMSPNDTMCVRGKQLFKGKQTEKQASGISDVNHIDVSVVPPAPCLQVLFTEISTEFLCDEIQRVSVNFQNAGAVPLDNIYMATSVPNLLSNCEFTTGHNYTLNECDGPAAKDKLGRKNHITPLPNHKLLPGQSQTVSIWIKAPSKKGSALVDLLIYYESTTKISIPRYRLVRHFWKLAVLDSIEIIPAARMSYVAKAVEEIIIPITVTNINKTHYSYSTEVTVLNVALLSNHWQFMPEIVTPEYISLQAQESCHMLVKARRLDTTHGAYSSIAMTSDTKLLETITKACVAFAKKTEVCPINLFEDEDLSNTAPCSTNGVIGVQWQALVKDANKQRIVTGQTHMPLDIIRRKKDPYEDMEEAWFLSDFSNLLDESRHRKKAEERQRALQNQVAYNMEYPHKVEHNFEKDSICLVKVVLHLHNIIEETVSLIIDAIECESNKVAPDITSVFCGNASNCFRWVGKAKSLLTLRPLQTVAVDLVAALPGPGTYDLGAHVKVLCQNLDEPDNHVLQTCQIQSTLVVINSSS